MRSFSDVNLGFWLVNVNLILYTIAVFNYVYVDASIYFKNTVVVALSI